MPSTQCFKTYIDSSSVRLQHKLLTEVCQIQNAQVREPS
jgi:hypothetical protein